MTSRTPKVHMMNYNEMQISQGQYLYTANHSRELTELATADATQHLSSNFINTLTT